MNSNTQSITKRNCLLCSGEAVRIFHDYPGYKLPSKFDIFHCPSCNTSFSTPRNETNDIYELIYRNGPDVRWYERYWRNAEIVRKLKKPLSFLAESEDAYWAVRESLSVISKKRKKSIKMLEIGCGLGYLTYSLNKEGYDCTGLDISSEAITQAIKKYGNYYIHADLYEYASKHCGEYDIIILTEVIEHLEEIVSFMRQLSLMLKRSGKIILTTPNKSFYPKDIIWATDIPPVHCWWLSEESIKVISSQLKMKVFFLDFSKYYRYHTAWVDLNEINIPFTPPVFDENGNLIRKSDKIFISPNRLRKVLTKIYFLKFLNSQIRYLISKNKNNLLIPKKRGPIICAILKKSESK